MKLDNLLKARTVFLEVGKRNSAADQQLIQQIHDHASGLGADCNTDGMDTGESLRAIAPWLVRFSEAGLRVGDSQNAKMRAISGAVHEHYQDAGKDKYPDLKKDSYPSVRDVFDKHVIVQHGYGDNAQLMKHGYVQKDDGTVKLSDGQPVEMMYSPVREGDNSDVSMSTRSIESGIPAIALTDELVRLLERDFDPNVGGGVDRDKLPDSDFAGKNRSFPIKTPGDVKDALQSIGRAGKNNYDAATLKANILRIAKRKGFPIPDSDKEDAKESAVELDLGYVALTERAVRADGTMPIKLIQPGWGSSGHYSPALLERDGPKIFRAGTKMYLDHPTKAEEAARPERSVKDLAAELVTPARYISDHKEGPGLYADAKVFEPFRPLLEEIGPHIGVSIRALGAAKNGTAEGRTGPIVERLVSAKSVDFVTEAGAGGRILQLFEAARGRGTETLTGDDMEIKEALNEIARLKEKMLLQEARTVAAPLVAKHGKGLPGITLARLTESLAADPAEKNGQLDLVAFEARIVEAVKAEREYLGAIAPALGVSSGRVAGMASGSTQAQLDEKGLQESLKADFVAIGVPDKVAAIAAAGHRQAA